MESSDGEGAFDYGVVDAGAEAPPSMEFLAQRQLSDVASINIGDADIDGE